jgi:hypothetical protein
VFYYFEIEVDVFSEFLFARPMDVRVVYPFTLIRSFSHFILVKLLNLLRGKLSVHHFKIPDKSFLRSGECVITEEIRNPEITALSFGVGKIVSDKCEKSNSGNFQENSHIRLILEIRICFSELVVEWVYKIEESQSYSCS